MKNWGRRQHELGAFNRQNGRKNFAFVLRRGLVDPGNGQSRVIVEKWCAQLRGFKNRPGEIVVCAGVRYMLIPAGKSLMIVGGECRDEPFWGGP